ncbi:MULTISPECIES: hypothetical protein [Bacillaceae]|uniref:hypothetical protein n=1 Tax=Shouchella oshimensis TaxID=290588 RepID=UPI0006EBFC00|nr:MULTISPECIES: hypothetical protein [Bacillaceae]
MKPRLPISLALFMLVLVVVGFSNEGTVDTESTEWKPEKLVEMVAPASAGGGWDTFARVVSNAIMEHG